MRYLVLLLLLLSSCDKSGADDATNSKLLGERLIAKHGEGLLASPVLIVFDSGYIVGQGSADPEFVSKVAALGLKSASSLSAGVAPVSVREFYGQEGVEFGVSDSEKVLVVDSTSSLTIRLLFGRQGIDALRACEAVNLDRVCKVGGELRARLGDVPVSGATIIDGGIDVAKGEIQGEWVVFPGAPELGDEAELELHIGGGVRCNQSKWLVDPRDSCAM